MLWFHFTHFVILLISFVLVKSYLMLFLILVVLLSTCLKRNQVILYRSIAVAEVLCRLSSKCICKSVFSEASHLLSPLQFGVGVSFGCEAIVHSVSSIQSYNSFPPDYKWILQVNEIRSQIPSVAAWMECCYSSRLFLHLGRHIILSCCGVQQGDPLGTLGLL